MSDGEIHEPQSQQVNEITEEHTENVEETTITVPEDNTVPETTVEDSNTNAVETTNETEEVIKTNIEQDSDINQEEDQQEAFNFEKKDSDENLEERPEIEIYTPLKFVATKDRLYNQNPIQIAWEDLSYTVKIGPLWAKKPKTILQPMTGYVSPGQVLAVMGPSGSGKTSMLNILVKFISFFLKMNKI